MIMCPFCDKTIPEHGACCGEVGHGVEVPDCVSCKGHGVIGGHYGQTAESFGYETIDCPDCEGHGYIKEEPK